MDCSWDPLGTLLGLSWDTLGPLLAALGRSWGALGALLGGSWAALGRSWAGLGRRSRFLSKNLGLAAFFRLKLRKNRGFESHFVPKPRFLRGFWGHLRGGPRQVGGARGRGFRGVTCGNVGGFHRTCFDAPQFAALHGPLLSLIGSVAGSPVGLRPQYRPLSQGSFVVLA